MMAADDIRPHEFGQLMGQPLRHATGIDEDQRTAVLVG